VKYLNTEKLECLKENEFQQRKPFPWLNPAGVLTDIGHRTLIDTLPNVSLFARSFDYQRKHRQKSHDRYVLEYVEGLDVHENWQAFIEELRGPVYREFICRMFGISRFDINCHWHYAPAGCSVSPHLDAARKYGSQVFYLNTPADWKAEWGGQTVVLDDKNLDTLPGNPEFEDMEVVAASEAIGNYSLLFSRGPHSWHGVRALNCPKNAMRRVFIVVVNRLTPLLRIRRAVGNLPDGLSSVAA